MTSLVHRTREAPSVGDTCPLLPHFNKVLDEGHSAPEAAVTTVFLSHFITKCPPQLVSSRNAEVTGRLPPMRPMPSEGSRPSLSTHRDVNWSTSAATTSKPHCDGGGEGGGDGGGGLTPRPPGSPVDTGSGGCLEDGAHTAATANSGSS